MCTRYVSLHEAWDSCEPFSRVYMHLYKERCLCVCVYVSLHEAWPTGERMPVCSRALTTLHHAWSIGVCVCVCVCVCAHVWPWYSISHKEAFGPCQSLTDVPDKSANVLAVCVRACVCVCVCVCTATGPIKSINSCKSFAKTSDMSEVCMCVCVCVCDVCVIETRSLVSQLIVVTSA